MAINPLYSDPTFIQRFEQMWTDGVATKEMAARFGVSKNAVIGLRSRMNLPPRPSPIKRAASETEASHPVASAPRSVAPPPRPVAPASRGRVSSLPPLPALSAPPPPPQPPAPPPAPAEASVALEKAEWMTWFNSLPFATRQRFTSVTHAPSCPLHVGGSLWSCVCGATLPGGIAEIGPDEPAIGALPPPPPTPPQRPSRTCCYPYGHPGRPGFRFCENPVSDRRSSYCDDCADRVYQRDAAKRRASQPAEALVA
jgi:GcrA cell cycle regulator